MKQAELLTHQPKTGAKKNPNHEINRTFLKSKKRFYITHDSKFNEI